MRSAGERILAPYQPHSPTSREAAVTITPGLNRLEAVVLAAFRNAPGGLTDEQLIDVTHLQPSTARPRRVKLQQRGLIANSGSKRPTRSERNAVVWLITAKGRAA